jgi:hypothetical protein
MQKTLSLSLAACLTLAGCSQPSSPWSTVRSVRVDTRDAEDPSAAYAQHVSGVLRSANVEHKIVTYQYRYRTALREEAIGTRTAVLYRDDRNPSNPWWLTDERVYKPVWLPGEDENRQVSFYLHRPATVVSVQTIGDDGSKRVNSAIEIDESSRTVARLEPVKKTERSRWWSSIFAPRQVAQNGATRSARSAQPAPSSSRYATLFRARHGTTYDPASITDRRKMELLLLSAGSRQAGL